MKNLIMKTMIEIQFAEKNVTDKDLDKYVKETLKAEGIKTTEVDTLNMYYVPTTAKLFYVANKKDGAVVEGELDVNAMPDYSVAPVKKACAPRKTAAKKTTKKAATK